MNISSTSVRYSIGTTRCARIELLGGCGTLSKVPVYIRGENTRFHQLEVHGMAWKTGSTSWFQGWRFDWGRLFVFGLIFLIKGG